MKLFEILQQKVRLLKNRVIKAYPSIREQLDLSYLLNLNTGEVHYLPHSSKRCMLHLMNNKNKQYLTNAQYSKIIHTNYKKKFVNGCRYCNARHSTDNR